MAHFSRQHPRGKQCDTVHSRQVTENPMNGDHGS